MKTCAVFLLLLGLAFARGDTAPDKTNQLETKNVHQVVEAPTLETASTKTGDVHVSHMQYKASRMGNQDLSFQQQPQQNEFYGHDQAPQVYSQDPSQHYQEQNLDSYSRQGQSQIQQFHRQDQNLAGSPAHPGQENPSHLLSSQRGIPSTMSSFQDQSNEQGRDFSAEEQYSGDRRPQQEIYQYRGGMEDVPDQFRERKFDGPSSNQIASGFPSSGIRTSGLFPQVYRPRPAFSNQVQPIVLPGVTKTHSSSVIVSGGLKNLPVVPALVYSAGPVATSHAVAYSRPLFQGGAFVKQHWQTPYARYVYSHFL